MKIALIGAGNMAWQLAQVFTATGKQIEEIYSRSLQNAQILTEQVGQGRATNQLDFSGSKAQLYILCVSDNAYSETIKHLQIPVSGIIAHTSGSHSLEVLSRFGKQSAVFYPFQTMSKDKIVNFSDIPICLEAQDAGVYQELEAFAMQLSPKVHQVSSVSRKKLHLAAVFACNFANHAWAIAESILLESNMDFSMLHHLVEETLEKVIQLKPSQSQTGPAIRHDDNIVKTHLEMLKNEDFRQVYQKMTSSIQQFDRG